MTLDRLIKRYGQPYRGVVLLDKPMALSIIDHADEFGDQLLGIDGFVMRVDGIQPLLQWSLDTSALDPKAAASSLRNLLQRVDREDLLFEIVPA